MNLKENENINIALIHSIQFAIMHSIRKFVTEFLYVKLCWKGKLVYVKYIWEYNNNKKNLSFNFTNLDNLLEKILAYIQNYFDNKISDTCTNYFI